LEQQEYDDLVRRLVAVSERQETTLAGINTTLGKLDERQADMQRLLASLNTKQQRIDVTLIALDATTEALRELLTRHEATFERLGRLLDERLPPAQGNGRTEG
jgi:multidrug efflux pump subunit AcrA (membrane-fusion protein)